MSTNLCYIISLGKKIFLISNKKYELKFVLKKIMVIPIIFILKLLSLLDILLSKFVNFQKIKDIHIFCIYLNFFQNLLTLINI